MLNFFKTQVSSKEETRENNEIYVYWISNWQTLDIINYKLLGKKLKKQIKNVFWNIVLDL